MSDPLWTGGDSAPKADWYPDPSGSGGHRYWDGSAWTDHIRSPTAPAEPYQPAINRHASPKSPILAIVLSVLWLGTGHFYAGRTDALPIVFAVVNFFLWGLLLFCWVGWIPWIPMVIFSAIDARKSVIEFNTRHGLQTPT